MRHIIKTEQEFNNHFTDNKSVYIKCGELYVTSAIDAVYNTLFFFPASNGTEKVMIIDIDIEIDPNAIWVQSISLELVK